jgi:hypothetical protein
MNFGAAGMLHDLALIQNHNHIRVQDGAELVGDDQTGLSPYYFFQGFLYEGLAMAFTFRPKTKISFGSPISALKSSTSKGRKSA